MPHRDAISLAVAAMREALSLPPDDPARLLAIADAYALLAQAVSTGITGLLNFLEEHMGVLMRAQEQRANALHQEVRALSASFGEMRGAFADHDQASVYYRKATDDRLDAVEATQQVQDEQQQRIFKEMAKIRQQLPTGRQEA